MSLRSDTYEVLVLDAALLALAEQETSLRDLRSQAGTLLAASALTVSFLGTHTLERDGLSIVAWMAIVAFIGSLLATVSVLVPSSELSFSFDASHLDRDVDGKVEMAEVQLRVARSVTKRRLANQPRLDRLALSYRQAAFALLAQAALWIAGLSPIV